MMAEASFLTTEQPLRLDTPRSQRRRMIEFFTARSTASQQSGAPRSSPDEAAELHSTTQSTTPTALTALVTASPSIPTLTIDDRIIDSVSIIPLLSIPDTLAAQRPNEVVVLGTHLRHAATPVGGERESRSPPSATAATLDPLAFQPVDRSWTSLSSGKRSLLVLHDEQRADELRLEIQRRAYMQGRLSTSSDAFAGSRLATDGFFPPEFDGVSILTFANASISLMGACNGSASPTSQSSLRREIDGTLSFQRQTRLSTDVEGLFDDE